MIDPDREVRLHGAKTAEPSIRYMVKWYYMEHFPPAAANNLANALISELERSTAETTST